jgi:hypothetical protein
MHRACHEMSLRRKLLIIALLRCNSLRNARHSRFVIGNWPSHFWDGPLWCRVLDRLRGLHYSVDPLTGDEYTLPDEVLSTFVPTGQTSKNNPELKALAEAIGRAQAQGRPNPPHSRRWCGEKERPASRLKLQFRAAARSYSSRQKRIPRPQVTLDSPATRKSRKTLRSDRAK